MDRSGRAAAPWAPRQGRTYLAGMGLLAFSYLVLAVPFLRESFLLFLVIPAVAAGAWALAAATGRTTVRTTALALLLYAALFLVAFIGSNPVTLKGSGSFGGGALANTMEAAFQALLMVAPAVVMLGGAYVLWTVTERGSHALEIAAAIMFGLGITINVLASVDAVQNSGGDPAALVQARGAIAEVLFALSALLLLIVAVKEARTAAERLKEIKETEARRA